MPSFPQYALESLVAFLLLLLYYRIVHKGVGSFRAKRWQLRWIPVLAYLLPLVSCLFNEVEAMVPKGVQVMSFQQFLDFQLPELSITVGKLVLGGYFLGVLVTSFRLADRLWLVSQLLKAGAPKVSLLSTWQAMPTALLSHLILNWSQFDEKEKAKWAGQWLPIHPLFGWEALLVELLVVLNWWNPLVYRYRDYWAELYALQANGATNRSVLVTGIKSLGYWLVAAAIGILLVKTPVESSPTYQLGLAATSFFDQSVYEKKIERPHQYVLEWGGLRAPLQKFANPNGYSATLELELAEFQKLIKTELKVYRDSVKLEPGTMSILYRSNQTGTQAYINGIDAKEVKLLERQSGIVYNDSLNLGDEIVLFGEAGDIYLSKVEIRIKDPNGGYEPALSVPPISFLEANMAYQIVARRGKRTLVKIDPGHPNAQRILQLYTDERQYEIVEIPGFRTNRHYLSEAETLASKVEAVNSTLTFLEKDAFYLPEYQSYQDKAVQMAWGEMEASPSHDNYPLDSFLLSIANEPVLLVGDDTLEIVSFEVILSAKDRPARSFQAYRTHDNPLKDSLLHVTNETSVFFEKIVVLDKDSNGRLLFPASFAFHVGLPSKKAKLSPNEKKYMLMIEKGKTEAVGIRKNHESR